MNVLFISHTGVSGDSAIRICSVGKALRNLGIQCTLCVSGTNMSINCQGSFGLSTIAYSEAKTNGITFSDGNGPDLIHVWTPHELVHKITEELAERYKCKYIVHLENNEGLIPDTELNGLAFDKALKFPAEGMPSMKSEDRSYLNRYVSLIARAAGCTTFIEQMLAFKPPGLPSLVFCPGFNEESLKRTEPVAETRRRLGIPNGSIVIGYNGDVHETHGLNSLLLAVQALRRNGRDVMLLKIGGQNGAEDRVLYSIDSGRAIDLDLLPPERLWDFLAVSDILVQLGRTDVFLEDRFPSNLPEFFASGKPVLLLLLRTNALRILRDGIDALFLHSGNAIEIAQKLEELIDYPELAACIGASGKEFATLYLNWSTNARSLKAFYEVILGGLKPVDKMWAEKKLDVPQTATSPVKLIAFYLPQFHPIKENDEFWGKGFTEWTNVTRARPQYQGHYQPQLPADCGLYDLRLPAVLVEQADLARLYGIYGFCFYYYWFGGRRLLGRPLQSMLESGRPNFPFCICWANENWTRNWDGSNEEILIRQDYSGDSCTRFIQEIIPIMRDPRYIRVAGRPMLLVYRVDQLPDPIRVARRWREMCVKAGIGSPHLCAVQSFGISDPREYGFDAAVEFPPHSSKRAPIDPHSLSGLRADFEGYMEDYAAIVRNEGALPRPDYQMYRGIMPAWDNTPRRGSKARIVAHSSPVLYERWLSELVKQALERTQDEPVVFINAWNEWAEGAYLEPDQRLGKSRLIATRNALRCGTGAAWARGNMLPPSYGSNRLGLPDAPSSTELKVCS